jgi:predicted Zn finger-like uncharacterized protein
MDVTCERCGTAYEFDDALVSERGTTVKCTSCGHQFKVRRPQAAGAPERWLVRTIDGRELEFRALRELQAAIAQSLITRDDVLSRGGSRPRRLGSIAELEPFFATAAGGPQQSTNLGLGPKAPPRGRVPTPVGSAPSFAGVVPRSSEVSIAIPLPGGSRDIQDPPSADEDTKVIQQAPRRSNPPPPPPRRSNPPPAPAAQPVLASPLPGVVVSPKGAPPPPVSSPDIAADARAIAAELSRAAPPRRTPPPARADDVSQPTAPFPVGAVLDPGKVRALIQDDWSQAPAPAPAVSLMDSAPEREVPRPAEAAPAEPTPEPAASRPSEPAPVASEPPPDNGALLTPTPAPIRPSIYGQDDSYGEPRFSTAPGPRRSSAARVIVGLFVAGMVVFAFATVGRKMLAGSAPQKGGEADARVATLLSEGEKGLADGDLELAKEQLDKASVLAERDPRVVSDLARLAAAKADIEWLRVRLLAADDPEQSTARRELEQAVQRARRAADRAAEVAPGDAAVIRSRIDAARLGGDLDGARKLVGSIAGPSSQPENALILAELDLAEARPDWPTVIGRLRTAVGGEGNIGRARALLTYALARSGDLGGAKAELERLKALRPHPLAGALTGYIMRADRTVDVSALPDASGKPRADKAAPSAAPAATPREPAAAREPAPVRDHPAPAVEVHPAPDPVAPSGPIDTSDLPGVKVPPAPAPPKEAPAPKETPAPTPPPANTTPPGVDTSDLPGFK